MIEARLALCAQVGLGIATLGALSACATDASSDHAATRSSTSGTMEKSMSEGPLSTALAERKAAYAARSDAYTKKIYGEGIDAVRDSGVVERAKNVGETAPGFTLPDATGETVSLDTLLDDGPVVLVWYRGGWCPYCNLTLKAYRDRLDEIESLGATLVAISPELPDNALSTKEKNGLEFAVLTDEGNRVARRYGVVFDLTDAVHANYNKNFALDAWNGQSSGELPLAATYVIDRSGEIRYAFLHPDYRERAEPSEVIDALRAVVN